MSSDIYARMLDKSHKPAVEEIKAYIGEKSAERLSMLEGFLNVNYNFTSELRFSFGNKYGWGYKCSHRKKHLCYIFFERESFTITFQIGDKLVAPLEESLKDFLPKTQELWSKRYPCGAHGGWVHYRILSNNELKDIYEIIKIKCKPIAVIKFPAASYGV